MEDFSHSISSSVAVGQGPREEGGGGDSYGRTWTYMNVRERLVNKRLEINTERADAMLLYTPDEITPVNF